MTSLLVKLNGLQLILVLIKLINTSFTHIYEESCYRYPFKLESQSFSVEFCGFKFPIFAIIIQ